jgi:hypothetical protein
MSSRARTPHAIELGYERAMVQFFVTASLKTGGRDTRSNEYWT